MRSFLFICFTLLLTSCSSDDSGFDTDLIGTWELKVNEGTIESTRAYTFNSNGSFTSSFTGRSIIDRSFLGYRLIEEGVYKTSVNSLNLTLTSFNISSSNEFVPIDELNQEPSGDPQFNYLLKDNGSVLGLTPICPPNADCIGELLFVRTIE